MESQKFMGALIGVLIVLLLISLVIYIWYAMYNSNDGGVLFIFKRKPKVHPHLRTHPHPHVGVKPRCPCGGHDPRECKCGH